MNLDSYTLLIFLAGIGAGITIAILTSLSQDIPWVIRRLYRFARFHQLPSDNDLPPSIKPIVSATIRDLERQGRLTSPQPPAAHAAGK